MTEKAERESEPPRQDQEPASPAQAVRGPRPRRVAAAAQRVAWCALLVFTVTLAISPWLAWSANLTGWEVFPATDGWGGRIPQVAAVALAVPTALAGAVVLASGSRLAARWLGWLAAAGMVAVIIAAFSVIGQVPPGIGMGLALMAYPGVVVSAIAGKAVTSRAERAPAEQPRWSMAAMRGGYLAAGDHVVLTAEDYGGSVLRLRLRNAATGALRAAQPPADAIPSGWLRPPRPSAAPLLT
jgi:hypothetical protein